MEKYLKTNLNSYNCLKYISNKVNMVFMLNSYIFKRSII